MTDPTAGSPLPRPTDLAAAYGELQAAVLSADDVVELLEGSSTLAASLVPDASCGITMDHALAPATVVSSDHFALSLDEIQYGFGEGPCLQAMTTDAEVAVPDLATDRRWPRYRELALARGARSSLSVPLGVGGHRRRAVGAVNLYARRPDSFPSDVAVQVRGFVRQAGIALMLVLRHAEQVTLEKDLRAAFATRAVIDQALGILMGQRRITSAEAWVMLREASSRTNRKMSEIAADLIVFTTGQPPTPPRPFASPR